jgi:nucleoside 2-deoxyribosyltransferase
MDKRYQVFVSSTFTDLQEERKEVIQALLEMDCIPAGMELFPAANDDQWTLIKKVIDDCDYYIVIVAGRYGSLHPTSEISYTEMEYNYAIEQGKPVIGLLHKSPNAISEEKTEKSEAGRNKLENFREIVERKTCRYWTNASELKSQVFSSLFKTIKSHPAIGWVKADLIQDETASRIYLGELFNFGTDDILFVFTHGGSGTQSILPTTSTEAFIAINNFIGILIRTGWKDLVRLRDTTHINDEQKTKNLVIVTGPKNNTFVEKVFAELKKTVPSLYDFNKISAEPERWEIFGSFMNCPSPSYEQEEFAKREGKDVATQKLEDVAMIIKIKNPWNSSNKIFIIAGIRGIGTWGAAEYIRKHADELYERKRGSGKFKKSGDFSALVKVTYENYDIASVELCHFTDIT